MTINRIPLTEARWRRRHPALRAELRQVLGSKSVIINHQVLAIARELCACGAYSLALAFYGDLNGTPPTAYRGCGFGLLMSLHELMGEDPTPIGEMLLLQF